MRKQLLKTVVLVYGDFYKRKELIIDRENTFNSNKSLKSLYPTIYFFNKKGALVKVSECSPKEDGIGEILNFTKNIE